MTGGASPVDDRLASGVIGAMASLDSHLSESGESNAAFGVRVGVSEATISRLRNGKQSPSLALIRRIAEATGGVVTANDFCDELNGVVR